MAPGLILLAALGERRRQIVVRVLAAVYAGCAQAAAATTEVDQSITEVGLTT